MSFDDDVDIPSDRERFGSIAPIEDDRIDIERAARQLNARESRDINSLQVDPSTQTNEDQTPGLSLQ